MIEDIKWWCYKVLPLVYEDSLSYYELLCKVIQKINEIIPVVNITDDKITDAVNKELQTMITDGTLDEVINEQIFGELNAKVDRVIADNVILNNQMGELQTNVENEITEIRQETTQSVKNVSDYYLNVLNFGADNTGSEYSDTAFSNALSEAASKGSKLLIPIGTYKLKDTIYTDSSFIYKDSGIYSEKPLMVSSKLKESSYDCTFEKFVELSYIKANENTGSFQSAVYIPNSNHIILGFSNTDTYNSLLVEMDSDFKTVYKRKSLPIGHCNDLTFNQNTNMIVCAPIEPVSTVYLLNPTNLELVETKVITGIPSGINMVEYNSKYNVYFMYDSGNVYIVDSNFTLLKAISSNSFSSLLVPTNESATQGSFTLEDQFIMISSIANNGYHSGIRLTNINFNTGGVHNYYDYPTLDRYDEAECGVVINNWLFLLSYDNTNLLVRALNIDSSSSYIEEINTNDINTTKMTYYVDESKNSNGNGLTEDSPFNDLSYAVKMIRYTGEAEIILLADTQKTDKVEIKSHIGILVISGKTKTIKIKRPITISDTRSVYFKDITINNDGSINTLITVSRSFVTFYYTATLLGDGTNGGTKRIVNATNMSDVICENTAINNCDIAIRIGNGSRLTLWQTSGNGNNILVNNEGGIDLISTGKANATTVVKSNTYGGLDIQGYKTLQ